MAYKIRLHSHDVKYGSGSGQQSVTGTDTTDDVNSHWAILGPLNKTCKRGCELSQQLSVICCENNRTLFSFREPIECGSTIRFHHLTTRKFLHSHLFSSPLSGSQEVSAFGENGNS